jgi:tRNA threonylcarbamoyladenosine biosynthesis protein TsaB
LTRLLAVDTSFAWGSIALLARERGDDPPVVVAELGLLAGASHAGNLVGRIDRLLAEVGWAKSSLDAYAAARGPGSFTGLRVGLGTIRGLGLAAGRPCVGVITLEALAEAHGPAELERVPLMDAGRREIFCARYDATDSPPVPLREPWLGPAEEAVRGEAAAGGVLIPGPGTALSLPAVTARCRLGASPRGIAGAVGRLALLHDPELTGRATELAPLYVRPPDAWLKRRERQ